MTDRPTKDQYRVRREWVSWQREQEPDRPPVFQSVNGWLQVPFPTLEEVEAWDRGERTLNLESIWREES